jgi:capsid assembly protease
MSPLVAGCGDVIERVSSSESPGAVGATAMVIIEGRNWAMHEQRLQALLRLDGMTIAASAIAALKDSRPPAKGNGVSLVSLKGPIMPGPSLLSLLFGGDDGGGLPAFMSNMRDAQGDPDTSSIVMDIDSPGGVVDLVPEAADELRAMRDKGDKPIVAVANTAAMSAAYWLASQAHEVVVTPSGEVGSVGVYNVHRDLSGAMEKAGVKHTLIHAGARKVEGNPYAALDEEASNAIQQQVDDYYEMFVKAVAAGRGVDVPEFSEGMAFGGGRSYLAKRAVNLGLADRVATLGETVRRMSSGRARVRQTEPSARGTLEFGAQHVQYDKQQRLRLLDALTSR